MWGFFCIYVFSVHLHIYTHTNTQKKVLERYSASPEGVGVGGWQRKRDFNFYLIHFHVIYIFIRSCITWVIFFPVGEKATESKGKDPSRSPKERSLLLPLTPRNHLNPGETERP